MHYEFFKGNFYWLYSDTWEAKEGEGVRIYGPGFFITEVIFLQMIVQHPEGGSAARLGEYKPA